MKKQFEKYISDYGVSLTKLCLSLTNNQNDAKDLYQATWEKAMRKYKRYDKSKPFDKWLYTICVNTYRDELRRFDKKNVLDFKSDEEKERFLSSIPYEEVDHDEYIALYDAMKILSADLKEVLVLFYFKDYSVEELSEILSIPEGTIKSRLNRARNKLRKELDCNDTK